MPHCTRRPAQQPQLRQPHLPKSRRSRRHQSDQHLRRGAEVPSSPTSSPSSFNNFLTSGGQSRLCRGQYADSSGRKRYVEKLMGIVWSTVNCSLQVYPATSGHRHLQTGNTGIDLSRPARTKKRRVRVRDRLPSTTKFTSSEWRTWYSGLRTRLCHHKTTCNFRPVAVAISTATCSTTSFPFSCPFDA